MPSQARQATTCVFSTQLSLRRVLLQFCCSSTVLWTVTRHDMHFNGTLGFDSVNAAQQIHNNMLLAQYGCMTFLLFFAMTNWALDRCTLVLVIRMRPCV